MYDWVIHDIHILYIEHILKSLIETWHTCTSSFHKTTVRAEGYLVRHVTVHVGLLFFYPTRFRLISLHNLNPFPHIYAFWRLCSRRFFGNIVTKEEIAQNVQFLLLPQCFPLFVIGYPFNYGDFLCFDKIHTKSSAAELSYERKG